jgi:hypothetical protein
MQLTVFVSSEMTSPYCYLRDSVMLYDDVRKLIPDWGSRAEANKLQAEANKLREKASVQRVDKGDKILRTVIVDDIRLPGGGKFAGAEIISVDDFMKLKQAMRKSEAIAGGIKKFPFALIKKAGKVLEPFVKKFNDLYDHIDKKCEDWQGEDGYKQKLWKIAGYLSLLATVLDNVIEQLIAATEALITGPTKAIVDTWKLIQNNVRRRRLGGQAPESLYHVYRRVLDEEGEAHWGDAGTAEVFSRWAELHRDALLNVTGDEVDRALDGHHRSLAQQINEVSAPACMTDAPAALMEAIGRTDAALTKVYDTVFAPVITTVRALVDKFRPLVCCGASWRVSRAVWRPVSRARVALDCHAPDTNVFGRGIDGLLRLCRAGTRLLIRPRGRRLLSAVPGPGPL